MPNNSGYIKIVSVIQKFFDQAISGNWSYNPEHFPDNEVPVSVITQDFLTTYKYGWKTSYYQNTYDIKTDEVKDDDRESVESLLNELLAADEEDCESCKILILLNTLVELESVGKQSVNKGEIDEGRLQTEQIVSTQQSIE